MVGKPRHDTQPKIETGKMLQSAHEYNKSPSKENFRDKTVDQNKEYHREAHAEVYKRQQLQMPD